jgi:hypothetical protein
MTDFNLSVQFWKTLWSSSKVTLSNRSVGARTIASAQHISDSAVLSSPIQRTRSRTGSDQANKADGPVSRSSFGQLPAIFPRVLHSAIIHVNFHRLCDPVSAFLIALPVNAFQCLINEVLVLLFISLSEIGSLQQPVGSEKYCDYHFYEPFVGDILGTISSRALANIVGES